MTNEEHDSNSQTGTLDSRTARSQEADRYGDPMVDSAVNWSHGSQNC